MRKLNLQEARNVLSAWTALEVLSPQSFRKPEDLAVDRDSSLVALFNDGRLPWENGGEKVSSNTNLFYQVIIGTIDLECASSALIKKYGASHNLEQPQASGEAVIGVVVVNQYGYPIKSDISVAVSSFAWGVPQALKGNLELLCCWPQIERKTAKAFDEIFRRKDDSGKDLPLNKTIIDQAYAFLIETFSIPAEMVKNKKFAIRNYLSESPKKSTSPQESSKESESAQKPSKESKPPQPLLLNSFYLDDLFSASLMISSNHVPAKNLLKYLGVDVPERRYDILDRNNRALLEEILAPKNIPPARWPTGRQSLVLLQQAAVNLSMTELKHGGILAVNGPPGTGKTTLLRDIVAGLVVARAKALSKFDDPAKAFSNSGCKIKAGQWWICPHRLDSSLKGFELLIASSNNKAVENISAELPSLHAIADEANDLRYFSTLSDELLQRETWGLISAVLGNASNLSSFRDKFWWHKDFGLGTYLSEIYGKPQMLEIRNPKDGKILERRKPKIIKENNPPRGHAEALTRWQQERERFEIALKVSTFQLTRLQKIRDLNKELMELKGKLKKYDQPLEILLLKHWKLRPNILLRIFRTAAMLAWEKEADELNCYRTIKKRCDEVEKKIAGLSVFFERFKPHFVDDELFSKSHEERHKISPWCDAHIQVTRDQVFIVAMKLHKAFIDAAAKPLHDNLGLLMQNLSGQANEEAEGFIADLWSSFFLVVPSVSTTFASVGRMLKKLPPNTLGWLLIDEAGQALPQAAVGAIMRTKRTVITGDPLQIEPIVVLPDMLTKSICKQFGVDPSRFNAPEVSVQTLADTASPYFSEFHGENGSRSVGFPLLVHRRCAEPMFGISNVIAYEGLMVQAKKSAHSPIRDCLGPSLWFDVQSQGKAQDKWCPEEGGKVLELLYKLKHSAISPNLYIVTPFRVVAGNLKKIIKESGILKSWVDTEPHSWVNEHVGTVHTVQGREAEAVILVLGAPMSGQNRSRIWAGEFPNLLNVAVTRAKEVIYVIGNKNLWSDVGVFEKLNNRVGTCN